jgi:competence protein ComGC
MTLGSLSSLIILVLIIVIIYFVIRRIKKNMQRQIDEKMENFKSGFVDSDSPPKGITLSMSNIEKIKKLHELQQEGIISEEEFNRQKTALMNDSDSDKSSQRQNTDDIPGVGIKVLSFLIPIAGLILFLVWHNDYPNKSRASGKFALIGFIVIIVIWVFTLLIIPLLMYSMY